MSWDKTLSSEKNKTMQKIGLSQFLLDFKFISIIFNKLTICC